MVVGAGCSLTTGNIPESFPRRDQIFGPVGVDRWLNPGDSEVVAPGGDVVAGPLHEEHGLLCADLGPGRAVVGRRTLDIVGLYARNNVFQLTIDRAPRSPVVAPEQ